MRGVGRIPTQSPKTLDFQSLQQRSTTLLGLLRLALRPLPSLGVFQLFFTSQGLLLEY